MAKFSVGDVIINRKLRTIETITHVYSGDELLDKMRTIHFYIFENGKFALASDVDKEYNLSLKGTLKKL